jgi:hypothetical protein
MASPSAEIDSDVTIFFFEENRGALLPSENIKQQKVHKGINNVSRKLTETRTLT